MADRISIPMCAKLAVATCALITLAAPATHAEEHVVHTRRTQWVPDVLFVNPGDTIVWRGMRSHETMLIEGMGPEGGPAWRSELDAEGFSVTLTEEGAYVYSCDVHIHGGMVGAIVVGNAMPANLNAIDAALENVRAGRVFVERAIGRLKRALARR